MVRRTAVCCTVQLHANTRNYTGVAKSRLDRDCDPTATRLPCVESWQSHEICAAVSPGATQGGTRHSCPPN